MQLHVYLLLFIFATVQEVMTNIWEPQTSLDSGQDTSTSILWGQTGSSYESGATILPQRGQEGVVGAERGISPLPLVLGVSTGPAPSSGPSLQGHRLLHSSSASPGLTAAGPVDRETPPLPQEAADNGADVSGGAHATQGHSVGENARAYLTAQHTPTTDTLLGTERHTRRGDALPHTKMTHTLIDTAVSGSGTDALSGADTHATYTAVNRAKHTTRAFYIHSAAPTWSATPPAPFSPPQISLLSSGAPARPRVPGTNLPPHGSLEDGLPGASQSPAWRGQRSTDELHPNVSLSVTSDPSHAPSEPHGKGSDSTEGDTGTKVPSISPRPDRTNRLPPMTHHPSLAPTQSPASSPIGQHTGGVPRSTPSYTLSANTHTYNKVPQTEMQTVQSLIPFRDTHTLSRMVSPTEPPPTVTPSENNLETTQDPGGTTSLTGHPLPGKVSPDSTAIPPRMYSPDVTTTPGRESAVTEGEALPETRADSDTYTSIDAYTSIARPSTPQPTAIRGDAYTHQYTLWTETVRPNGPYDLNLTSYGSPSSTQTATTEHKTSPTHPPTPVPLSPDAPQTYKLTESPPSTTLTSAHTAIHSYITTDDTAMSSHTDANPETEDDLERGRGALNEQVTVTIAPSQLSTRGPNPPSPTTPPQEQPRSTVHPYHDGENPFTSPSSLDWSSTTTQAPKYFIVPDQLAAIRVESIELLLQIIVEESRFDFTGDMEKDTAAWVEPYLLKAPGFSRLHGVWSRGIVVQCVIEFRTQGALEWLGTVGPSSLLERTGLTQAVREGRGFGGYNIVNITLGGLQGGVCDWLLRCPEGYKCVSQPHAANHSCSSVCHYDHCHNHGICTHHSGQLPVCRCLVGEHFWYMGLRCDVRMTRARLVGACLAILVVMVTLIAIVALVAVRRYRAILIQAKVDQTRSSYRRFNHFDELSARFWLRSWAGSADSLDNPAFTRSDELLHLRALDRTCCYHDDTLSLASTCPSNGTRLNTVFPHSSQYGWRGSMISMGECGLDSGKASDLSVCSWPVEPIQWTPFPLLQQLASHRTHTVGASRPRSYCEGMELVDLEKLDSLRHCT